MFGGGPGVEMPYRVESFQYDDGRNVFQGRLDYEYGTHYWGSKVQGEQTNFPGEDSCIPRYTYIVFTSIYTGSETLTVDINIKSTEILNSIATALRNGSILAYFLLVGGLFFD